MSCRRNCRKTSCSEWVLTAMISTLSIPVGLYFLISLGNPYEATERVILETALIILGHVGIKFKPSIVSLTVLTAMTTQWILLTIQKKDFNSKEFWTLFGSAFYGGLCICIATIMAIKRCQTRRNAIVHNEVIDVIVDNGVTDDQLPVAEIAEL